MNASTVDTKSFLEGPLPKKLFPKAERLLVDDLVGEIQPRPIAVKVSRMSPEEVLANLVDQDELRPALTGILYCAVRQSMVVTNGHYLFIYPAHVDRTRIVRVSDGQELQGSFPDYLSVIPFYEYCGHIGNLDELMRRLQGLNRANQFTTGSIPACIRYHDREVFVEGRLLLPIIRSFLQLGISSLRIEVPTREDKSKAIVFRSANNPKIMALLMPIYQPCTQARFTVLDLELDLRPTDEILSHLKTEYDQALKNIPWGVSYHKDRLCEAFANDSVALIEYEKEQLLLECKKWQTEIDQIKQRLHYWSV